jgi:ribosomal protein L22
MEHVQQEMENLHSDMNALQQELTTERQQGRGRHAHLVETLSSALQARDAALGALKRLEEHCTQRGMDIASLAVYEVRVIQSCMSRRLSPVC